MKRFSLFLLPLILLGCAVTQAAPPTSIDFCIKHPTHWRCIPSPSPSLLPSPSLSPKPSPSPSPSPSPIISPSPSPSLSPSPNPSPSPSEVYGSAIGMDALNNTIIGGPNLQSASYRFRAVTSSNLSSIRVYIIGPTHSGYGAGTGGIWKVSVQTDSGTTAHGPSSTILASTTFKPVDDFPVISWSSPASLVSGQLYHVVFENIDASPTTNYASLDGVFMYSPTTPRQPRFSDVDWGQPERFGTNPWADTRNTIPIAALTYTNGVTQGQGYMENWDQAKKTITGTAMAREIFTTKARTVSEFNIRLSRVSGTSPLNIRLETSNGSLVSSCTIPAENIIISTRNTWGRCTFSSVSITGAYNVVLSTATDTKYSIYVIRKGISYGMPSTTYFADGYAQFNSGSGWVGFDPGWSGPSTEGDLQFYFR